MERKDRTPEDIEVLKHEIEKIPFFYHKIDLGDGIRTPGQKPYFLEDYKLPDSFAGKRVLDVGAWDGFFTFEALKRGAREVIAIDNFSDTLLPKAHEPQLKRTKWKGFDLCRQALGYSEEVCKRYEMDVMTLIEIGHDMGTFDAILLFGVINQLKHPTYVIEGFSKILNPEGIMYVEAQITDDISVYRGEGNADEMVMEFYPCELYMRNAAYKWGPTLNCLASIIQQNGFPKVDCSRRACTPTDVRLALGYCVCYLHE